MLTLVSTLSSEAGWSTWNARYSGVSLEASVLSEGCLGPYFHQSQKIAHTVAKQHNVCIRIAERPQLVKVLLASRVPQRQLDRRPVHDCVTEPAKHKHSSSVSLQSTPYSG